MTEAKDDGRRLSSNRNNRIRIGNEKSTIARLKEKENKLCIAAIVNGLRINIDGGCQ